MQDLLTNVIDIIHIGIFNALLFYTIVFYLLRVVLKSKRALLNTFHNTTVQVIIFSGIVFAFFFFLRLYFAYTDAIDLETKDQILKRLTGKYWYGFWFQPIFFIVLTQLLWIKSLSKNVIYHLFISLAFIFTIERLVIITTSLHRDFLPSNWTSISVNYPEIIIGITLKLLEFILFIGVIHLIKNTSTSKIKHLFKGRWFFMLGLSILCSSFIYDTMFLNIPPQDPPEYIIQERKNISNMVDSIYNIGFLIIFMAIPIAIYNKLYTLSQTTHE